MSKSLEDFFRNNRAKFDSREPSDKVWQRVVESTKPKLRGWNSLAVWRSAAAVFFALSVYLFLHSSKTISRTEGLTSNKDFTDVESFYKEQIAEKVAFIEHFDNGSEEDQFTQDLQKLDAMYQVLREEMKSKPSEKVKDALVLNMLVRIDLLNQQIHKLEELNRRNTKEVSS